MALTLKSPTIQTEEIRRLRQSAQGWRIVAAALQRHGYDSSTEDCIALDHERTANQLEKELRNA